MKRRLTTLLACACLLIINVTQVVNAQTRAQDDVLVKAAFIYNFTKFTRWPENTWTEVKAPLNLCTIGEDRLTEALKPLNTKIIKGHPVAIQALKSIQAEKDCHLLYIATSENESYKDILKSVQNQPVLTISEIPGFVRSKGIIELYRGKNQTHFIINLAVAEDAGLEFSSRLLDLAVVITRKEPR